MSSHSYFMRILQYKQEILCYSNIDILKQVPICKVKVKYLYVRVRVMMEVNVYTYVRMHIVCISIIECSTYRDDAKTKWRPYTSHTLQFHKIYMYIIRCRPRYQDRASGALHHAKDINSHSHLHLCNQFTARSSPDMENEWHSNPSPGDKRGDC